jgi:hypothetical protein
VDIDVNAPEFKEAVAAAVEKETGGLKKKNEELLDELKPLKELKDKFKDFDPAEYTRLKAAERDGKDKEIKDPVELRNRIEAEFAPKLTKAEEERDAALQKLNSTIVENQLTSALAEAGVAKEYLRAVKADLTLSREVEVRDDGVIIDGKPVGDFVKAWSAEDGKSFIGAPNNNGGGGKGGKGGGAVGDKKASEMTRPEKAAFISEHGGEAWRTKINNES